MSVYGGKYLGWNNWNPNNISGNTLWLDGGDTEESVIIRTDEDVIAWRDKSNVNYTIEYSSDFSVDVDGWTNGGSFGTLDANIDNIGGENDTLKWTNTATNGVHHPHHQTYQYSLNKISKVTLDVYIPSGQTTNGFWAFDTFNSIGQGDYRSTENKPLILEQWNTISFKHVFTSTALRLRLSTDELTSYAADGDVAYFKNIKVETTNGNDFIQTTLTEQPSYSAGTISFIAANLTNLYNNDLSWCIDDTEGEWIVVGTHPLSTTQNGWINFAESTTVSWDSPVWSDGGGGFSEEIRIEANRVRVNAGTLGDGEKKIVSHSSNGSNYKLVVNNKNITISMFSGTDDGAWHGNITDSHDIIGLFAILRSTPIYYTGTLSEIIYYNRQLTNKEREAIFHYLNTKYSIY